MIAPDAPAPWPAPKIIAAALRGIRGLQKLESGSHFAGVRSLAPWICWNVNRVVCLRCETSEENPPPVELDKEKAILATGVNVYALHILSTLLYPFFKAHESCPEPA